MNRPVDCNYRSSQDGKCLHYNERISFRRFLFILFRKKCKAQATCLNREIPTNVAGGVETLGSALDTLRTLVPNEEAAGAPYVSRHPYDQNEIATETIRIETPGGQVNIPVVMAASVPTYPTHPIPSFTGGSAEAWPTDSGYSTPPRIADGSNNTCIVAAKIDPDGTYSIWQSDCTNHADYKIGCSGCQVGTWIENLREEKEKQELESHPTNTINKTMKRIARRKNG